MQELVQAWSKHALVKCIGLEAACFEAVQRGDELTVRSCLEGGGRANATREVRSKDGDVTTGVTLLMDAARKGHERVAALLLQHDAEVNLQDGKGLTALMWTAYRGHEWVIELLLRRGAEINLQDSDGGTALMMAAANGHERVVELLLRHGADINLCRTAKATPH